MTALRPERETDASYGDQSYEASGALEDWDAAGAAYQERYSRPYGGPHGGPHGESQGASSSPDPYGGTYGAPYPYRDDARPVLDDETMALRIAGDPPSGSGSEVTATPTASRASAASSASSGAGPAAGGRAARRKAAKRRGGRHGGRREAAPSEPADSAEPGRPLSRVEARRQARLRKPSPGVIASRAIGEVFITTGVLMLLFVTYQLWWTNIRAHAQAGSETHQLQDDWASGKRNPGVFEPGQGFAILHIPKLDVVAPIAEGVSKEKVLDKGMVGHYGEPPLKTAMPDAKTGNFGLAAHRNTHGEPFRYINKLKPGDAVVVETQDEYFVYKVTSTLPVTSPSNTSVLDPVPRGSGFTGPGRYITLTTCTPEFTSKYRLVVWGKMVEERPRSKGKPDALIE
ncbi:sortase A [Streptomyces puniciscabiei]|uniref:Sortase A n=1 Tax=Streptomyces puniciscabiei TaxID=164348 RepID=A0A542UFH3_9ACTN|nr:class E sortase [Streptomyces puniciscabiei]TQK97812.1 sortase A [Streptomyces puniciscabiei]